MAQFGSPVLELGCGSGRVLLPLAAAGYRLVGVDRDLDALKLLTSKIAERRRSLIDIVAADFLACPFAGRFPLILAPCNTLSTLQSEELPRLLVQIRSLLRPDGRFAASMPNPVGLARLPEEGEQEVEAVLADPGGEDGLQVSSTWQRDGNQVTFIWLYDRLKSDGLVTRTEVRDVHHIVSREEWHQHFISSGFFVEGEYGDFSRTPYRDSSPHLILVVRPA